MNFKNKPNQTSIKDSKEKPNKRKTSFKKTQKSFVGSELNKIRRNLSLHHEEAEILAKT